MKDYKQIIAVICMFLFQQITAQLSGTISINATQPASASNFQNFSTLAAQLNTAGISGPLVIDVVANSGPYNEQPVFTAIPGATSTNTILINGNNNLLLFSATNSVQPWTLLLNGADYLCINNLNVEGQGATYAAACILSTGADFNTFKNCNFTAPSNGTSTAHIPLLINGTSTAEFAFSNSGNYNLFLNCGMYNGVYCVATAGPLSASATNNMFVNCIISDWYNVGIYSGYQENFTVNYCSFSRPNRVNSNNCTAIAYYSHGGGISCIGNCMENFFGGAPTLSGPVVRGILVNNSMAGSIPTSIIANNIINNLGANDNIYAMELKAFQGTCSGNTVILNNANPSTTSNAVCSAISATNTWGIPRTYITNNFISITQGNIGPKYGVDVYFFGSGSIPINNNKYFISSNNGPGYIGTTPFLSATNTFSTWQGAGYDSLGVYYTANPNPTLSAFCTIAGPLPVSDFNYSGLPCQNTPMTFLDSSTNSPVSWNWYVDPSSSATINSNSSQNPQITFSQPGTYTISVIATNSTGPGFPYSQTLTVNPPPILSVIPSATSVCVNTPVSFTAQGAAFYNWSNGGGNSSVANYIPVGPASYTVLGSSNSCTNSEVVSIQTYSLPVASITGNSIVCSGDSLNLFANGGVTYTWSGGSGSPAFGTILITNSTFSVIVKDSNGCLDTAFFSAASSVCTGFLNRINPEKGIFSIRPNPVFDKLFITLINKSVKSVSIEILDASGGLILTTNPEILSNSEIKIDVSNLIKGLYFIRLKTESTTEFSKIIKD